MVTFPRFAFALFGFVCLATSPDVRAAAAPQLQAPLVTSASQQVGVGDQVRVEVFGDPDMTTTVGVADDGSVRIPLVGLIRIGGLSLTESARRIEEALKAGQFLVNPQVTVTVVQSLSQRVSVLGEVAKPGRYPVDNTTTVLDVIALAGGMTEKGSDRVYILRPNEAGAVQRLPVSLRDASSSTSAVIQTLKAGDSVMVPRGTFYINGQVVQPGEYRIDGDMLLFEAIARAGGVTPMGSASRVEIKRRGPDDQIIDVKIRKNTRVEPGDVIRVKERLF